VVINFATSEREGLANVLSEKHSRPGNIEMYEGLGY
jgi:hypothetical protein